MKESESHLAGIEGGEVPSEEYVEGLRRKIAEGLRGKKVGKSSEEQRQEAEREYREFKAARSRSKPGKDAEPEILNLRGSGRTKPIPLSRSERKKTAIGTQEEE